jgi:hypothetical protein
MFVASPIVKANPKACRRLGKVVETIDKFLQADVFKIIHMMSNPGYRKYTFFRRHPQYCGLWLHHARHLFHSEGLEYAAVPGAVMVTTQLYHALHQERLLRLHWKELETLRNMQGNACYFVGDPPEGPIGYWKNFCLTLGMSVTSFASNRRGKKIVTNKAGVREMKFKGVTGRRFVPRMVTDGRDRRLLDVETVLRWIAEGEEGRAHNVDLDRASPQDSSKPVVHRLAAAIHAEATDLKFNYFQIHDNCWRVLTRIYNRFEEAHIAWSRRYKIDNKQLPFIVGFAFSLAAGKVDPARNIEPSMALLQLEAVQFENFLENGRALGRSSGRTVVEIEKRGGYGNEAQEEEAKEGIEYDKLFSEAPGRSEPPRPRAPAKNYAALVRTLDPRLQEAYQGMLNAGLGRGKVDMDHPDAPHGQDLMDLYAAMRRFEMS